MNSGSQSLVAVDVKSVPIGRVADSCSQFTHVEPVADADRHDVDTSSSCEVGLALGGRRVQWIDVRHEDCDVRNSDASRRKHVSAQERQRRRRVYAANIDRFSL